MNVVLNEKIKSKEVQLINEIGVNVGVISKVEALRQADELGLDLVQVNESKIPVCKILDYKKLQYEQNKASRETKETKTKWKEIQLKLNISDNDLMVKANTSIKLLNKGNKVKVILLLKGREINKPQAGINLLNKFKSFIGEDYKVTKEAKIEGVRLIMHIE